MNDKTDELLRHLGERARKEAAPRVDTSHAVLDTIRERDSPVRPLGWVAAGACAAALLVMYSCYGIIGNLTDPLGALFQPGAFYW